MQHRIDQDTAATMAKKTLMMMSKREIPLFLENYLVWFAYSIGVNPDLDADIKCIIKEGSHLGVGFSVVIMDIDQQCEIRTVFASAERTA